MEFDQQVRWGWVGWGEALGGGGEPVFMGCFLSTPLQPRGMMACGVCRVQDLATAKAFSTYNAGTTQFR